MELVATAICRLGGLGWLEYNIYLSGHWTDLMLFKVDANDGDIVDRLVVGLFLLSIWLGMVRVFMSVHHFY